MHLFMPIMFATVLIVPRCLAFDAGQLSAVEKAAKPAPEKASLPVRTAVYGMVLSGDNKWLVTGGDNGTARMWEVATGKLVRAYGRHEKMRDNRCRFVTRLEASSDGRK
jgi:WD40 repeat protein